MTKKCTEFPIGDILQRCLLFLHLVHECNSRQSVDGPLRRGVVPESELGAAEEWEVDPVADLAWEAPEASHLSNRQVASSFDRDSK